MQKHKFSRMVAGSLLSLTLLVQSMGGAVAYAESVSTEAAQSTVSDSAKNNLMGGLLFAGMVALLSGHHSTSTASTGQTATTKSTSGSVSGAQTTSTSQTASASNLAAMEKQAVNLLNSDRAANGLPSLKQSSALTKLAENYSQDMISRNFFSHTDPDGKSPFDRMKAAGISYQYAGENIAINSSVQAAEQAFMASAGHRANILNTNYKQVGIGVHLANNGSLYVTQEFTN